MIKIDKSTWARGPWDNEPDFLRGTHAGFATMIKRVPSGHLCGYVGVPEDHWLYGIGYDALDIDVHGGLTYASTWGDQPGFHWFGFDCSHVGDQCPMYANTGSMLGMGIYRDLAFVKAETESLADQIAAMIEPPLPSVVEAAKTLLDILDDYGNSEMAKRQLRRAIVKESGE